jgi:PTH1 family peptidyl-tRNA hydrolase
MGVGPGPAGADLADFVLEEFTREERDPVEALLDRAAEAAGCLIEEGPEAAMGRFNG